MSDRCTCECVDGTLKLTVVSGAFEGKSGKKREKLVLQVSGISLIMLLCESICHSCTRYQ